ncbi:MAG: fatty acid desaturase [Myxococcaceae bacterium]|nr:fatty acid desaturase [Myxococcaceae bacterium]
MQAGSLYGLSGNAQRVHVLGILVVPALGVAAAIALAVTRGITAFDVTLLAAGWLLAAIGIEVGFHRLFSHAAFDASPRLEVALAMLGSLAAQGPALYWAALHRHHHRHSDGPDDPHSPATKGFWHAHAGWMFDAPPPNLFEYVPELFARRQLVRADRRYFLWLVLGLVAPSALGAAWYGTLEGAGRGLLFGGLVRIFVAQHGIWSINSFCHLFGARPFASRDASRNVAWLALPTLGGSLHNAHHAFPFTAKNAFRWYEVDPGWHIIRLLQALGLATNLRVPDERMLAARE